MTPNADKQKYVKGEWELINAELQEILIIKINDNKLRGNVHDKSNWLELRINQQFGVSKGNYLPEDKC